MPPPDAPRHLAPGDDEFARRRSEVRRGLTRSHRAVVAASGLVGLFALTALWMGGEARRRAEEARVAQRDAEDNAAKARMAGTRLWDLSLRTARQERLSRAVGQRVESLQFIREAARFHLSRELRDEALSALLLPDVGTNLVWYQENSFEVAGAYEGNFEHFILSNDRGRAIVRRTSDATPLMDTQGLGISTTFWGFSPDGRFAAMAFRDATEQACRIGLWDWRHTNLVARFPTVAPRFGEQPFDFSPDGRRLWLLTSAGELVCYDLYTRDSSRVLSPDRPARAVRLSPSGKFAALACGSVLEVWDLPSREQRAMLTLTDDIWRLAWQPGDERLAIGCDGALCLWDLGATNVTRLKEGKGVGITDVFFEADASLLFVGGWHELGEVWDTRRLQRVLESGVGRLVQLGRDQQRIATYRERVGFGIREFFPPLGVRSWPGPPSLGGDCSGADLDPGERWLLTAHPTGWLLRDADSGRELARESGGFVGSASFAADASSVLAWTSGGLVRWPLVRAVDGGVSIGPKHLLESAMLEGLHSTCFSADGRFTAQRREGVVTVAHTDDPSLRVGIPLDRPGDNLIRLSPDGRWLITGRNNQHDWSLYDTQSGRLVRTLATKELAGVTFHPVTGQPITCSATGWECWPLPEAATVRRGTWREPALAREIIGFAPGGRVALVSSSPSAFQLYDLEAGRDFATLDFRDAQRVFACRWSGDGQRLFLFGNDGGITRLDLAALRRELAALGLDWSDDDPSREFPMQEADAALAAAHPSDTSPRSSPSVWQTPPRLAWWVAAGLVATVAIGHSILRYQRTLFAGYLETETLAEQRAEQLRDTHSALAHSEKMKALGTMATGVAHDFNNLLSVIRLSSDLIEERATPDTTTRENFESIQQAVQRGRGIVNSMLGYARDDGQVRPFAPGGLISDAVALLSRLFLSGLVLQIDVAPALPEVNGRRGRVEQMLLNLVVNAAEAMGNRGTLRLRARSVPAASECVLPPRPTPEYVELSVVDNGPGIAPEVLPRIFEPFFTTKNKGAQRGTGLGLSMLYTMAKEDGVGVGVTSEPGRGTAFRLFLPVESAPAESTGPATGRNSPVADPAESVHPQP